MNIELSRIIANGEEELLRQASELVVTEAVVKVLSDPNGVMVMVRHIDPLGKTPFYLGEAYVTECEVEIDGHLGYGCVLGYEHERALYGAVLDAIIGNGHPLEQKIEPFLLEAEARLHEVWEEDSKRVGSTKVDFEVR